MQIDGQSRALASFTYESSSAESVYVAGSFNDWNPKQNPLIKKNKKWSADILLKPGYYYYKFVVDGKWIPDPKNEWKINDGGNNFNSIIKVGNPKRPTRKKAARPLNRNYPPKPILENNPEWIELYYRAWEMAWAKISHGTEENGFVENYMDEGFNELIFQWDTNFMAAFAMYAPKVFPAMESLDNFYMKQRKDGYIQRVYREDNGAEVAEPTQDEQLINPPLFAWIELKYYHVTGDTSRLKRVLPILVNYYNWIENNCRSEKGQGLYYITKLGSGMDNVPHQGVGKGGWVDISAQQALAAKSIAEIAQAIDDDETVKAFESKHKELERLINIYCWNPVKDFFYDYREDGRLSNTMHIGAFWTLISEVCSPEKFLDLREHLTDPREFWRPHVVPTISKSNPVYDPKGHYWLGGVWAPTNYMVVKGVEAYGDFDLANRIAHNHISNMAEVYYNFTPEEKNIAFEERYGDDYQTIWECYSPEYPEPATRWDNTFYSRQDFVGWSGLGPIAMLIENIIGLNLRADKNQILWHIFRDDEHGIEKLKFGKQTISLKCTPNEEHLAFEIYAQKSFRLEILWNDGVYSRKINPGINVFTIE